MIGFIGAGKCGMSLARYFKKNKINISGFYSNHTENCEFDFFSLEELVKKSDIIFITTSDGEIKNVWKEIKPYIGDKILCHASGALSSQVFDGYEENLSASVHPLLAFSSKNTPEQAIREAFFTLEGGKKALSEIIYILNKCGNRHRIIDKENKVLYHTAACYASNFVVAICEKAEEMMMRCGFDREDAHAALTPLMKNNMDNIIKHGTHNAITGPAARGDTETLSNQLKVVDNSNLYLDLCKIIFDMKNN